jgi:alpha(1,3/1,4) fucosyltransferase
MKKIRIDFCDFWPGFCKTDNFFWNLLKTHFEVELHAQPDFIIYSNRESHLHRVHNCVKIFFTVESFRPDWRECDYAFTCHYLDDPRHYRLPLYVLYAPADRLTRRGDEDWNTVLTAKKNFCAFVVGKADPRKPEKRVQFFHRLSRYRKVDSAGGALNNMGWRVPCVPGAKEDFLRSYKFNLAFENASIPGYTTEKLVEPMLVKCLPIYWGNPRVTEEFNTASFLNYSDFASEEALIEEIIALDRDDEKYLARLRQPSFIGNQPGISYDQPRLLRHFERIFSKPITPVCQRRKFFQLGRWRLVKQNVPPPDYSWM